MARWERRVEAPWRLSDCLRELLQNGDAVLGVPARSAFDAARPVSPDALDGVIEAIAWHFKPPSARFGGERLPLRLYPPDRFGRVSGGGNEAAPDRYRTGAPGRPTIMHLIKAEMERRAENGEMLKTIAGEAKALANWAAKVHPRAPRTTAQSIENGIRNKHRKLRTATAQK